MPELYGNKFKWELRAEIRQLKCALSDKSRDEWLLWKENFQLKLRLGTEMELREQTEQMLSELKKKLRELGGAETEAKGLSAMLAGLPGVRKRA
jgi:hypothetical protein